MRFTDEERRKVLHDRNAKTSDIMKALAEKPDAERIPDAIAIAAYNAKLSLRRQGIRADVVITIKPHTNQRRVRCFYA